MSNFDIADIALQATCPGNEMLYDDKGYPSIMVKIPKQTWAALGIGSSTEVFPAWKINGKEVDYLYFSKFQNVVSNDRAYSLPAQDPRVNITFDQAVGYCANKGEGWHIATRLEWMAIALWCLRNSSQPKGNNDYGKDASESTYKAVPSCPRDNNDRIQRVATGTGPLSWSHDGTPSGVWDMNGNGFEWQGGVRLVNGELQVISNDGITFGNDAADSDNSQGDSSALWRAIDGTTGELIVPNGSGTTENSVKASWVNSAWKWITGTIANAGTHNCSLENVSADDDICESAQHILMALGLLKSDSTPGIYNGDALNMDSTGERIFVASSNWTTNAGSGVFNIVAINNRAHSRAYITARGSFLTIPND